MNEDMKTKAQNYLYKLCTEITARSVGSMGNIEATDFFSSKMKEFGYNVQDDEFKCIDWNDGDSEIIAGNKRIKLHTGPYTLGCSIRAGLCEAVTLDDLKKLDARGKIILIRGELAKEQLMPKNFIFYNPDEHKEIIRTLEESGALAIISATSRNPELAGGMYPFPLIEDGDFIIPNAYLKDIDAEPLDELIGQEINLVIRSERIPSNGFNIVASKGRKNSGKILICAHIDSKKGTPGAIDNATGIMVLLLLAELLRNYDGEIKIEFVAFNGEDYFAVPGQMLYFSKYGESAKDIGFVINIDGAGFHIGKSSYSLYNCDDNTGGIIRDIMSSFPGIQAGESWIQSDHGMFVMMGLKAMAVTSDNFMGKLSVEITHTENDHPGIVDPDKIVEIAQALKDVVLKLTNNE